METNIDDDSPEILAYTMEKLLLEGAKDVFFTNIIMKKNRPATKITVLCDLDKLDIMENIIFSETSTIGIRKRKEERIILKRELEVLDTKYGSLIVKKSSSGDFEKTYPEYESAKKLAKKNNVPLRKIYEDFRNK